MPITFNEEIIVSNEYKHLNILKDNQFAQGALVNSAKIEYNDNLIRITASLEGHKILDSGWVGKQQYSYVIVEDDTNHQPYMKLSDIKMAYKIALKAALDESYTKYERDSIARLVVIFGRFVKRSTK